QVGGRLEDMGSFDKYIGGSPTNIACGTARRGEITPEELQNLMAGGQELAELEGSLGGTI
ncbi:MAG: hypothetical protein AAFR52_18335, partial [Pseudomonadota bacterium]